MGGRRECVARGPERRRVGADRCGCHEREAGAAAVGADEPDGVFACGAAARCVGDDGGGQCEGAGLAGDGGVAYAACAYECVF